MTETSIASAQSVQRITQATSKPSVSEGDTQKTVISSDFETFLKMLTTQLENQDPLDPVKSEDFAVQLATFSGVEQQVLTNDLLESLLTQNDLSGISQYAGWVGMEVKAAVDVYFDGSPVTIFPKPERTAQSAILVVENARNEEVQRISIPVSQEPVEWRGQLGNGIVPNGFYKFRVESLSNNSVSENSTPYVYSEVKEVRIDNGSAKIVVNGGIEIDADSVTALR